MSAAVLGVLVNRAAIPQARVVFSDQCLLTSRNGEPVLILRVGNTRGNFLLNPEIRLGHLQVRSIVYAWYNALQGSNRYYRVGWMDQACCRAATVSPIWRQQHCRHTCHTHASAGCHKTLANYRQLALLGCCPFTVHKRDHRRLVADFDAPAAGGSHDRRRECDAHEQA